MTVYLTKSQQSPHLGSVRLRLLGNLNKYVSITSIPKIFMVKFTKREKVECEMNTIFSYDIKQVTSETDLNRALSFARAIFKDSGRLNIPTFSKELWLARMPDYVDFILYAQHDDEIVGVVFRDVGRGNSITVTMVASDERYRHCGIASSLLAELEKRVLARGHHFIVIGALEAAEGFYLKCGYTPHLFVQSKRPLTLEKLRLLNDRYDEAWSYDDGTDIRLCIQTKGIDRELQHKYDEAFPGCSTQTLFTKYI